MVSSIICFIIIVISPLKIRFIVWIFFFLSLVFSFLIFWDTLIKFLPLRFSCVSSLFNLDLNDNLFCTVPALKVLAINFLSDGLLSSLSASWLINNLYIAVCLYNAFLVEPKIPLIPFFV